MSTMFDYAVYIGRFQPFHNGHLHVVREGLLRANHLIIIIGSAHQSRSVRNPWTSSERELMLRECLTDDENNRVICIHLKDTPYDDTRWVANIKGAVNGVIFDNFANTTRCMLLKRGMDTAPTSTVAIIGCNKDQTSFYLRLFKQWVNIDIDNVNDINATDIRTAFYLDGYKSIVTAVRDNLIPSGVAEYLTFYLTNAVYSDLHNEFKFVTKYRESWAAAPYSPTFTTVDCVLVKEGSLLLIRRKDYPGKDLLALPGGFINPDERLVDACVRELREETNINLSDDELKARISRRAVYDDPHRSARGRTITHGFLINLDDVIGFPTITAGDDAKEAAWYPINKLSASEMYEDHYFIIIDMLENY